MRSLPAAHEAVLEATHTLDRGEVVVLPAGTTYLAAADALEERAVLRLAEATGRGADRPLTVGVGGLDEVRHVARLTPLARRIWAAEPATLLLPALDHLPSTVTAGRRTVAVRLLPPPFARELASHFGPLALAGARGRGGPVTAFAAAALAFPAATLGIDAGDLPGGRSRVLDATGAEPIVVREGEPGRQPS